MDKSKLHQGQHQQVPTEPEIERARRGGGVPGINPSLHAPEISDPADEGEVNLHGDVPGSPYSSNPGEISLSEAAEQAKAAADAPAEDDDADTRQREAKSRQTGVSTETLAAKDDAATARPPAPQAKPADEPKSSAQKPDPKR